MAESARNSNDNAAGMMPLGRDCGVICGALGIREEWLSPNALKLSDRHRRSKARQAKKERNAGACSLERVVRLPAYRGVSGPPELAAWTPAGE